MEQEVFTDKRQRFSAGTTVKILILVALMLLSFMVRNTVSSPSFVMNKGAIASLDKKEHQVIALAGGAAGASILVSMLPGDLGSSISGELGDLASKLALVLSVIFMEKYLLTIFQYSTFGFIIPICCILLILYYIQGRESLKRMGAKLLLFGAVLCFTIPISERLSDLVYATHEASINAAIEEANSVTQEYQEQLNTDETTETNTEKEAEKNTDRSSGTEEKEGGLFSGITSALSDAGTAISDAASSVSDSVSDAVSSVFGSVADAVEKFRTILNNFLEAFAIMLVLCCGLPVATILIMFYLTKQIFGLSINIGDTIRTIETKAPTSLLRKKYAVKGAEDKDE